MRWNLCHLSWTLWTLTFLGFKLATSCFDVHGTAVDDSRCFPGNCLPDEKQWRFRPTIRSKNSPSVTLMFHRCSICVIDLFFNLGLLPIDPDSRQHDSMTVRRYQQSAFCSIEVLCRLWFRSNFRGFTCRRYGSRQQQQVRVYLRLMFSLCNNEIFTSKMKWWWWCWCANQTGLFQRVYEPHGCWSLRRQSRRPSSRQSDKRHVPCSSMLNVPQRPFWDCVILQKAG